VPHGALSFANLSSGHRDVEPGWMGTTKGVIAGESAHVGRVRRKRAGGVL
jgi:hypothetical protein